MYKSDQSHMDLFFFPLSLSVSSSCERSSNTHPFHKSEDRWFVQSCVLTSNCHPSYSFDTAAFAFVIISNEGIQKTTAWCIMTPLPGLFADPGATNCSASSIPWLNTFHSYTTHRHCVLWIIWGVVWKTWRSYHVENKMGERLGWTDMLVYTTFSTKNSELFMSFGCQATQANCPFTQVMPFGGCDGNTSGQLFKSKQDNIQTFLKSLAKSELNSTFPINI